MAIEVDFSLVSRQIIKTIRGAKSQAWVNQRLGAGSNLVHRWENDHAKTSWDDFLKFCSVFKIDVAQSLLSYFRYDGDTSDMPSFFSHLFSTKKLKDIEASTGISATKLRRLKAGKTITNLSDFLEIIFGLDKQDSLAFMYDLTKNKSIPALDEINKQRERVANAYLKNPHFGLILVCLTMPSYKSLSFHQDSFLSKISGVPIKEVNDILKFSLENGLVEKNGKLFKIGDFRISDRGNPKDMIATRKFWIKRAIDKIDTRSKHDAFGSIVFSTSQKARKDIIALYLRFFEDLKKIVDTDKAKDRLPIVLNFQMFNPGSEPTKD